MENLRPDVLDHFQHKMIPTILALQACSDISSTDDSIHQQSVAPVKSLDEFGDEILRCCEGLTLYQVNQESYCSVLFSELAHTVHAHMHPSVEQNGHYMYVHNVRV